MTEAIPYLAIQTTLYLRGTQIVDRSRYRVRLGRVVLVGISQAAVSISEFMVDLLFGEIAVVVCIREGLRSCSRRMVPVSVIVVAAASMAIAAAVPVMSSGIMRLVWRGVIGGVAAISSRAG